MTVKDIITAIEEAAPFAWQESYDNSGIQVGSPRQEVSRGLVALEVTHEVLREAIINQCDVIITHHPLIFEGLKRLSGSTPTEQIVMEAIRHNIAIVSVHTNIDNSDRGVNYHLGSMLGLQKMQVLRPARHWLKKLVTFCPSDHAEKVRFALFEAGAGHIGEYDFCSFTLEGRGSFRAGEGANPFVGNIKEMHYEKEERIETIFPAHLERKLIQAMKSAHPYEEVAYDIYPLDNAFEKMGSGMIGELEHPVNAKDFLEKVKTTLKTGCLRHSRIHDGTIQQVAVCGGSGAFLIEDAVKAGAQAFVTADIKYHGFLDAADNLLLVDAGHYETEQHTRELIGNIIQKKMINFALLISGVNTNPIRYF